MEKLATLLGVQVRELLHKRIRDMYIHPQFTTDVMKPLRMEMLMDQEVKNLSGGELQRVAITLALGTPADVYLIDEPSAYLDSEQRIIAAKVGGGGALLPRMSVYKVGVQWLLASCVCTRLLLRHLRGSRGQFRQVGRPFCSCAG